MRKLVIGRARKKRPVVFHILGLMMLGALGYIVFSFPPDSKLNMGYVSIEVLPIFFMLAFFCVSFLVAFAINRAVIGMISGVFTIVFLFLRMLKFTQPFYIILLFAIFFALLLFVYKRK